MHFKWLKYEFWALFLPAMCLLLEFALIAWWGSDSFHLVLSSALSSVAKRLLLTGLEHIHGSSSPYVSASSQELFDGLSLSTCSLSLGPLKRTHYLNPTNGVLQLLETFFIHSTHEIIKFSCSFYNCKSLSFVSYLIIKQPVCIQENLLH